MKFWKEYGSQILILSLGLIVLFALGSGNLQGPHPLEGKPAPSFVLPDLGGVPIDLANDLGKKVIVLDFWAIWCPPCRAALPKLDALAREFAGENIAFYAVNLGDAAGDAEQFLASAGVTMPALLDKTGEIGYRYSAEYIPQTVLIARDGMIRKVLQGASFGYERELRADIEALLK